MLWGIPRPRHRQFKPARGLFGELEGRKAKVGHSSVVALSITLREYKDIFGLDVSVEYAWSCESFHLSTSPDKMNLTMHVHIGDSPHHVSTQPDPRIHPRGPAYRRRQKAQEIPKATFLEDEHRPRALVTRGYLKADTLQLSNIGMSADDGVEQSNDLNREEAEDLRLWQGADSVHQKLVGVESILCRSMVVGLCRDQLVGDVFECEAGIHVDGGLEHSCSPALPDGIPTVLP